VVWRPIAGPNDVVKCRCFNKLNAAFIVVNLWVVTGGKSSDDWVWIFTVFQIT
jgi:hypothetical protein